MGLGISVSAWLASSFGSVSSQLTENFLSRKRRGSDARSWAIAVRAGIERLEDRTLFTQLTWVPGISSTWDTSTPAWHASNSNALVAWSNSPSDDAVFPSGTGYVSLGEYISANSVTINDGRIDTMNSNLNVGSISIANGGALFGESVVSTGEMTLDNGASVQNIGTMVIGNSTVASGASFSNSGSLDVQGNAQPLLSQISNSGTAKFEQGVDLTGLTLSGGSYEFAGGVSGNPAACSANLILDEGTGMAIDKSNSYLLPLIINYGTVSINDGVDLSGITLNGGSGGNGQTGVFEIGNATMSSDFTVENAWLTVGGNLYISGGGIDFEACQYVWLQNNSIITISGGDYQGVVRDMIGSGSTGTVLFEENADFGEAAWMADGTYEMASGTAGSINGDASGGAGDNLIVDSNAQLTVVNPTDPPDFGGIQYSGPNIQNYGKVIFDGYVDASALGALANHGTVVFDDGSDLGFNSLNLNEGNFQIPDGVSAGGDGWGASVGSGSGLLVDGTLTDEPVTVASGGTLGGSGTIALTAWWWPPSYVSVNVESGGILQPGDSETSTGVLTVGRVTFAPGASFDATIDGPTPGNDYDQVIATGLVSLGGCDLNLAGTEDAGDTIVLIRNSSGEPVNGMFNGLTDGAVVPFNGVSYVISYHGGSGNDVVLTDPPAAIPGNVTAGVNGGAVTLNWTEANSAFATLYNIYASQGGTYTEIDSVDGSLSTDSLYGLSPSTPYTFEVTAVNAAGDESAPSTPSTSITSPALPATPSGLTTSLSAGNVILNWTGDSSLATGYNIYVSTDNGTTFNYLDSVDGTTTYTTDGLAGGSDYQFEVTAQDASGETAASGSADQPVPLPPQNLAVTLSDDATSATITWTAPDADASGYSITRTADDGSGTFALPTAVGNSPGSIVDTSLDPTQAYTYSVTAIYGALSAAATADVATPADAGGGGGGSGTGPSATADTYTGNVENFKAVLAPGGTTVKLTWTYQGSGQFELEEEDAGAVGTNFALLPGWPASDRNAEVGGLNTDDTYNFRIRADHADGSVSDYVEKSVHLPIVATPSDPHMTLEPPTVTLSSGSSVDPGDWEGPESAFTVSLEYDDDDYVNAWPNSSYRTDDPYRVLGSTMVEYNGFGCWVTGTTGATYNITWFAYGFDGPNFGLYSPPSTPIPIALAGSLPQALTLQAGKAGSGIVTWTPPSGITPVSYDGDTIRFFQVIKKNGQNVAIPVTTSGSANLSSGQATLQIASGTATVFAVYSGHKSDVNGDGYFITNGTSPYSNQVQVECTVAPAAPAFLSAVYDPSVFRGQVKLSWANSSNNETGFIVQRLDLDKTLDESDWTTIGSRLADGTTFTDASLPTDNGPFEYRVYAYNDAGKSPTISKTVQVIGGPDITYHLLSIESELEKRASSWAGLWRLTKDYATDPTNNWDIAALFTQTAATAHNSGMLPDGSHTVTVAGGVYLDAEVNYWLYGVWTRLIGIPYVIAFNLVLDHGVTTIEGPVGKLQWFSAGYFGSFDAAKLSAISGVQPAEAYPTGEDTGLLTWHVGEGAWRSAGAN